MAEALKVYCGTCPDEACLTPLYFLSEDYSVICHGCLQVHDQKLLCNIYETTRKNKPYHPVPISGTEFVKVNGLSNFQCKLLSPFLTTYGMDKHGNATLLKNLGHAETIDCAKILGVRAFMIAEAHIDIAGYGRDQSGSANYLLGFLEALKAFHSGEERLVPLHVDGDGHCLVHALSRALTGRELFWHSLRKNLQDHLKQRLSDYKELLRDFHDEEDWSGIIEEADPSYAAAVGGAAGLGNIHIFALSNILRRPIMLLDSLQKMHSSGDYTGLFVPALTDPDECTSRSPLCIAWSGGAHNHFIPLVAIEDKRLPNIPAALIPELWAVPSAVANRYLSYHDDGSLIVGDGKPITIRYLQKLTTAMKNIFMQRYIVPPVLVEDLGRYLQQLNDIPGYRPEDLIAYTAQALLEKRLLRCIDCKALQEVPMPDECFLSGGRYYDIASSTYKVLNPEKMYKFYGEQEISCSYDDVTDRLRLVSCTCRYCLNDTARVVDINGNFRYLNGDKIESPNKNGVKYHWYGKEYDNNPIKFSLTVGWMGEIIKIPIYWFHDESDPSLNSKPADEVRRIIGEYFPNETENIQFSSLLLEKVNGELNDVGCSASHSGLGDSRTCANSDVRLRSNISEREKTKLTSVNPELEDKPMSEPFNDMETDENEKPVIVIKISMTGGETKTVKLSPDIGMTSLQNEISNLFGVAAENQVLKCGFPPKPLQTSQEGEPLGLKSGDKIKLDVKIHRTSVSSISSSQLSPLPEDVAANTRREVQKARRSELINAQRANNYATMWEYASGKPELFYPGGYFYEQFKTDLGLIPGKHGILPLINERVFLYDKDYDRLEVCLEPEGHFPIDDDITYRIKKFSHSLDKESVTQQTNQASTSEYKGDGKSETPVSSEKTTHLAPGYHTLSSVPTELSEQDKEAEREILMQKLKQINSEQIDQPDSEYRVSQNEAKQPTQREVLLRLVEKMKQNEKVE